MMARSSLAPNHSAASEFRSAFPLPCSALAGFPSTLACLSMVAGLICALAVLVFPLGCTPVPYTTGADSPSARPVTPDDLYYEESEQGPPKIEPGDSIEVVVRRGAGEERSLVTVRENGRAYVGALDVEMKNLTVPEAEARLTEQLATIIKNPRVEVTIKQKKSLSQKLRIFVLGGGVGAFAASSNPTTGARYAELDRKMSVGQLVAQLGYNDYSVLDEVRVIRGDARKPEVIPVDLQRLYQYGDRSRDIMLKNNDIVFVPRQRIGDWNAFLQKMNPTLFLLLGTQTMSPEALTKFLQNNNIQPIQNPTINVR